MTQTISLSNFMPDCDVYFKTAGFSRQAVMALLSESGISTSLEEAGSKMPPPESNLWGEALPLLKWLTINEAACIFSGFHPRELEHCTYDAEPYEVADARQMFCHAADAGEIECDKDGWNGHIQIRDSHTLNHDSIRAWCAANGKQWPLPSHQPRAALIGISSDVVQRLAAAEVQVERLTQALTTITKERDQFIKEVERLTIDLVDTTKEASTSKNEVEALQTQLADQQNLLSTQGRNSALLIMAALAKEAKLDVNQPSRTGEILSSSVSELGCSLTGRAISAWLSDIPRALETRAK